MRCTVEYCNSFVYYGVEVVPLLEVVFLLLFEELNFSLEISVLLFSLFNLHSVMTHVLLTHEDLLLVLFLLLLLFLAELFAHLLHLLQLRLDCLEVLVTDGLLLMREELNRFDIIESFIRHLIQHL